jgi:phosphate starvation-inducible protein PhoH
MSQLRSDILRKRKKSEIEKSEKLYKRNHIATPIQPYETSDSEDSGYSDIEENDDDDIIQVSDEDDIYLQSVDRAPIGFGIGMGSIF